MIVYSNTVCFIWNLTGRCCFFFSSQVNDIDVTNMSHTDAVNFLRAAPRTVRLVLGRVLELPKMPVLPHLLPDITLTCHKEELGNRTILLFFSSVIFFLQLQSKNLIYFFSLPTQVWCYQEVMTAFTKLCILVTFSPDQLLPGKRVSMR